MVAVGAPESEAVAYKRYIDIRNRQREKSRLIFNCAPVNNLNFYRASVTDFAEGYRAFSHGTD